MAPHNRALQQQEIRTRPDPEHWDAGQDLMQLPRFLIKSLNQGEILGRLATADLRIDNAAGS